MKKKIILLGALLSTLCFAATSPVIWGPTNSAQLITNSFLFPQVPLQANPPASNDKIYFKSDDNLYILNSAGVEKLIPAGGGGGTVTSVALTAPGSILSVGGSPVTNAGTLALSLVNQNANSVWAGPTSGGSTTPTFRLLVGADLPNPSASTLGGIESLVATAHQWINAISTSGVPSSTQPAFSDISGQAVLTSQVSGVLPIANGGTNSATALGSFNNLSPLTTKGDLLGWDTGNNVRLPVGINGQVLTAASGSTAGLTWATPTTGTVTSVAQTVPAEFSIAGSPITTSGTLAISKANETANSVWAGPTSGAAAQPTFRSLVTSDIPSLQVNKNLYVDGARTDSYTADGSQQRPFLTIGAAITQIITNADNSTHQYTINVVPGAYAETITLNNANLFNVIITSTTGSGQISTQSTTVNGLTSTATNTQLGTFLLSNVTINGSINFTGDVNGTNFCSSMCTFNGVQVNNSAGTITLNNVNNVSFYGGQIQGAGSVATFTNVAFGYLEGAEGFLSGTTLHLVDNPGGNVPSQYSGNYLLLSTTKMNATVTIDAGSEMDAIQSYFSSASNITNNGTIHSFQSTWSGANTWNNGSTTRLRGDSIFNAPTIGATATVTNQSDIFSSGLEFGQKATPANPPTNSDKLYFKNDNHLYSLTSAGTETKIDSGGTVTSVAETVPVEFAIAGSPITTNGTLAITKATQTANTVWAGPTSGGAVVPTFRSLVSSDIPSLSAIYLALTGGTMSGAINMGSNQINALANPTLAQDAATKNYVDNVAAAGVAKGASVYATTAALPANVYNNGASGVGATLTGVSVGALSIDGNAVANGQRVLIKNEVSQANNGIYTVTTAGSGIAVYVLTRATDFNQSSNIVDGATTFITSGSTLNATTWELADAGVITVGTTSLVFNQVAGPGTILAGTGLSIAGSTISLITPVVVANGGTNSTTATGAFNNLSPLTTKGDLLGWDSGNNVRVATGTNGQLLSAASGSTAGVKWADPFNMVTKTANYTAVANDTILADATGGGFTITLPLAASNTNRVIEVKKIDSTANVVAITASGSDLFDGLATQNLTSQNQAVSIKSNGTNWYAF